MSVDYTAVLEDLRAKRDAIDNLIAALENVARLNAPTTIVATRALPRAEKRVSQSVSTNRVPTVPPRAKAKPLRRATGDTSEDDIGRRVVAWVAQEKRGLRLAEIASGVGANPNALKAHLVQLVQERRLVRRGVRAGTRYWPAGTTAKEAL